MRRRKNGRSPLNAVRRGRRRWKGECDLGAQASAGITSDHTTMRKGEATDLVGHVGLKRKIYTREG